MFLSDLIRSDTMNVNLRVRDLWIDLVWHARPSQDYAPEAEKGRDGLAAIEISSHLRIKVVSVNHCVIRSYNGEV